MMEPLRKEFDQIKEKIEQLKESLDLKDEQIKTLKESLVFKKDQVQTLKNNSQYQKSQIHKLEELIKTREEQMESMKEKMESVEKSPNNEVQLKDTIQEKDEKIDDLEAQIEELKQNLNYKKEKITELKKDMEDSDTNIIDYTNIEISKAEILEKMEDILKNSINSIMICVPRITDLERLSLFDLKSSVAIKISCLVNMKRTDHVDLFKEFRDMGTVSIRNYEREDRYIIMRDNEELLFALVGNQEENHLAFYTTDSKHLKEFNPIVMDTWLRSKKI
ncbi:MAG: hypothetical protein EU547_00815 [Promethearchaeota archaeon]|nr:MAG: hypothetical protein EU547_00815 [Candidatus Lokiarchaeota archaeon]